MLAWRVCTVATATAFLAAATALADDAPVQEFSGIATIETQPSAAKVILSESGEYWIGLFLTRPSPALQAQLKLPKDQGLLVEGLHPKGPADKAGIQQYDILLKGNGKPLAELRDLVHLIGQVKDGKLALDLLRAGKHESVTVSPAKRPANDVGEAGMLSIDDGVVGGWMQQNGAAATTEGRPLEFHFIRPGQILPPGGAVTIQPPTMIGPSVPPVAGLKNLEISVQATSTLADGSKVKITRHGTDPAKVVVTHDKDSWEGTSGNLGKIPEKIRPEVEKLLNAVFDHNRFFAYAAPGGPYTGNVTVFGGGAAIPPGLPGPMGVPPGVEKRLTDLQKQVDELRHTVEKMQSKAKKKSEAKVD